MTKKLLEYSQEIENRIERELSSSPKSLEDIFSHLKNAKGKGIRSKCVISIALSLNKMDENILDLATGIELLHLATLVHDDVIDDAKKRRGITSVQSKFGKKVAVISGDYLFAKAFKYFVKTQNQNILKEYSRAVELMASGEGLQLNNNKNFNMDFVEYKKIIGCKTSALFSASFYTTGLLLELNNQDLNRLAFAGYYFGLVFQMTDDCLDYRENTHLKKELFKDLNEGVVTYPLIYALKKDKSLKDKLSGTISLEDTVEIVGRVQKSGGLEETKMQAKKYYDRCVKKANLVLDTDNMLIELLNLSYERANS